jgi:hypothetical protein
MTEASYVEARRRAERAEYEREKKEKRREAFGAPVLLPPTFVVLPIDSEDGRRPYSASSLTASPQLVEKS